MRSQILRLALMLLERFVPENEPLAGDLAEEFQRGRSMPWLSAQVLAAMVRARSGREGEIRPLRLVDVQPADALERSRRFALRFPPVNLSASPVSGIGGLGLVILFALVTIVMPTTWWCLLVVAAAGAALGLIMIAVDVLRRPTPAFHLL